MLCVYDLTRGLPTRWGSASTSTTMIDFDSFVFGGETPTEWLQARLYDPGVVHWDVLFTFVYTSYFIVPFALAGWLWARDRVAFQRFPRLVTLAVAGLATYILFPAAPPWMAGEEGLLDESTAPPEGLGSHRRRHRLPLLEGQGAVNLVAAVPSLHAAFTPWSPSSSGGGCAAWLRPLLCSIRWRWA